jgi:hypothetical protein
VRQLAIRKLFPIISDIDKIVYGHRYSVSDWPLDGYQSVCSRSSWLTEEEGRRLGLDDVLRIGQVFFLTGVTNSDVPQEYIQTFVEQTFGLQRHIIPAKVYNSTVVEAGLETPAVSQTLEHKADVLKLKQHALQSRSLTVERSLSPLEALVPASKHATPSIVDHIPIPPEVNDPIPIEALTPPISAKVLAYLSRMDEEHPPWSAPAPPPHEAKNNQFTAEHLQDFGIMTAPETEMRITEPIATASLPVAFSTTTELKGTKRWALDVLDAALRDASERANAAAIGRTAAANAVREAEAHLFNALEPIRKTEEAMKLWEQEKNALKRAKLGTQKRLMSDRARAAQPVVKEAERVLTVAKGRLEDAISHALLAEKARTALLQQT